MTAILNLYQAASLDGGSKYLRLLRFTLSQPSPLKGEGLGEGKQVLLFCVINYEVSERG
jgi:hypothetical protein